MNSLRHTDDNPRTGEMHKLMEEFRELYKEKLQRLEENTLAGASIETMKMKMRIMKSYVGDLSEQNEVLVQTIEELENEANERVRQLESSMSVHVSERDEVQMKNDCLVTEINLLKQENLRLQEKLSDLQYGPCTAPPTDDSDYKLQSFYSQKDLLTLVDYVRDVLKTGYWEEVTSGTFSTPVAQELTEEIMKLTAKKQGDYDSSEKLKFLEESLKQKDELIRDLKEQLQQTNMNSLLRSDLDSGFEPGSRNPDRNPKDNSIGIGDKDIKLMRLQSDLRLANQAREDLNMELASRNEKIDDLTQTVANLTDELNAHRSEKLDLHEALEMLETKLQEDNADAKNADEEMRQMKREVNILHERNLKCMDDLSQYEAAVRSLEQQLIDECQAHKMCADEVSLLRDRMAESHSANKDFQKQLKHEIFKREDLFLKEQRKSEDSQVEKTNLEQELRALQRSHNQLMEDHKLQSGELRAAKENAYEVEKQLATLSRDYEATKQELENSEDQVRHLEYELTTTKQQHKDTMSQVDRLTGSLHQIQDSFKTTRDALSSEVSERQDALAQARKGLELVQLDHEQNLVKVADQAAEIDKLRIEHNSLANQLADTKRELATLEPQLSECREDLNQANIKNGTLKEKYEITQLSAEAKERDLNYELEELKLKRESAEKDSEMFAAKAKGLEEKYEFAEKQLSDLMKRNQDLSSKIETNSDSSHQTQIELMKAQEECRRLADDIARRDRTIKHLESENAEVKKTCDAKQDESGKLQARLQALEITTQSEQEVLNSELARRNEALNRYKTKQAEEEERNNQLENKIDDLRRTNNQLQQRLLVAVREAEAKEETVRQMKTRMAEMQVRHATTAEESSHHKQVLEHMKREANKFENQLDNARDSLAAAEERNERLKEDVYALQSQQKELLKRLSSRDDMLHKVTVEATRLKEKYRLASSKTGESNETIRMLEDELAKTRVDLSETNRTKDEENLHRTRRMNELERVLDEHRQKHEVCAQQLAQREEEVTKLKAEIEKQQERMQNESQELNKLRTNKHKAELDLAVLTEKHRTAQEEVSNRDQKLMKLNSELNTVSEQYKGTKEENEMHLTEIDRLKTKLKLQLAELKDSKEQLDDTNAQLNQERLSSQQLNQRLDACEQELRVASKSCSHLQQELDTTKKDMKEELSTEQLAADRTRKDLASLQSDYREVKREFDSSKKQVKKMQKELDAATKDQQELLNELNKCEDNLQARLDEINSLNQDKLRLEDDVRSLNGALDEAGKQMETIRHSYDDVLERHSDSQSSLDSVKGQLETATNEVKEKDQLIDKLSNDLTTSLENAEQLKQQVSTCEEVVAELTSELQRSHEDNKLVKRRVETMKDENGILSQRLVEKQQELAKLQSALHKQNTELDEIKTTHTHSNQEYNQLQEHILKLERELGELRGTVSEKQHQLDAAEKLLHEIKSQLGELEQFKQAKEDEINDLENEMNSLQRKLDESDDRSLVAVEQEKAKFDCASRQLEFERRANDELKDELDQRDQLLDKMRNDIASCHENIGQKNEEIEQLEATCNQMQVELDRSVRSRNESERKRSEIAGRLEEMSRNLEETRDRYRECAQELAHYEERVQLKEQNLLGTQQELSERVTELARSEQLNKRLQAEVKQLKDRCECADDEANERDRSISKLKREIEDWKQQLKQTQHDYNKQQERIRDTSDDIANYKAQSNALQHEVKTLQAACSTLESEFVIEKRRHAEARDEISSLNKQIATMNNNVEELEEKKIELLQKERELQNEIARLEDSLSEAQVQVQRSRTGEQQSLDQLSQAERLLANSQTQEKLRQKEIEKYEDNLTILQQDLEMSQQQYKECHKDLLETTRELNDLKIQLASIEGTRQESMDQLGQSSKENANLKSELQKTWHQNQSMAQEIGVYEEKLRKLRGELRKFQNVNEEAEEELNNYEAKLDEMSQELSLTQEKNKIAVAELAKKEEQLVVVQVELSSLQNKHKSVDEEATNNKQYLDTLQQKYAVATHQIDTLQKELDQARRDGSRLRTESEAVVENVNTWVQDQKQNNDRLQGRLRDQLKEYDNAVKERDDLQLAFRQLKDESANLKRSLSDVKREAEKSKALQKHSAEQQDLILQLRNRLADSEREQEVTLQEKNASLDDLHRRLKQNVDCIQQLNHQLNNLSKENMRQRSLVEQEIGTRRNLELQLEAKEQSLMGLRAQLDARSLSSPQKDYNSLPNFDRSLRRDKVTDAALADARAVGCSSTEKLDKQYWIQRVGELSLQLQQSSSYWSDKVHDLSAQLEESRLDSSYKL